MKKLFAMLFILALTMPTAWASVESCLYGNKKSMERCAAEVTAQFCDRKGNCDWMELRNALDVCKQTRQEMDRFCRAREEDPQRRRYPN